MMPIVRHIDKSYENKGYGTDYFNEPHRWLSDEELNTVSPGQKWPGFKPPKSEREGPGKGLTDYSSRRTAPAELVQRPRRKKAKV